MGIVTAGPPSDIVLLLAAMNESTTFVETGTFRGDTTRWAAQHFSDVYTIERSTELYDTYQPVLSQIPGVRALHGDSRDVLPSLLTDLPPRGTVFWLDGHWSGGITAGQGDECPVLEELACLGGRRDDIILIDDARFFLCSPPAPHDPAGWPTLQELMSAVSRFDRETFVQIVNDVIFIVPSLPTLRGALTVYAQENFHRSWRRAT